MRILLVNLCTVPEQQVCDLRLEILRGKMERRPPPVILRVCVCAVVKQRLGRRRLARENRLHQRRNPVVVGSIRVCSTCKHLDQHIHLSAPYRVNYRIGSGAFSTAFAH